MSERRATVSHMTRYHYAVRTDAGRVLAQATLVVDKVSDVSVERDGDVLKLLHADGTQLDMALDPAGVELSLARIEIGEDGPVGDPVVKRVD